MPTDAVGKFLAECKDLSIFLDDVHKNCERDVEEICYQLSDTQYLHKLDVDIGNFKRRNATQLF